MDSAWVLCMDSAWVLCMDSAWVLCMDSAWVLCRHFSFHCFRSFDVCLFLAALLALYSHSFFLFFEPLVLTYHGKHGPCSRCTREKVASELQQLGIVANRKDLAGFGRTRMTKER